LVFVVIELFVFCCITPKLRIIREMSDFAGEKTV
jgi:hypothetical protein